VVLRGVDGVGGGHSFEADVVRLHASRCCSLLSALTLTPDGRESVTVVECRLLFALEDDCLDSVREIEGGTTGVTVWGVTAVVGAALGVVHVPTFKIYAGDTWHPSVVDGPWGRHDWWC